MGLPREFVVFDTETTGMPPGARLVELGAIKVRGDQIVERFQELIFPELPIPPKTTEIHGLSDQDVARSRTAADVVPKFLDWIGKLPLFGHNVSFDATMLACECGRLAISPPENATYCTLSASRSLLRRRSNSLSNLAIEFGIDTGRAHRASDDAETTLQLLWKLIEIAGKGFKMDQLGSGASVASFAPGPVRLVGSKAHLWDAAQTSHAVDLHYRNANGYLMQARVTPRFFFPSRNSAVMEALCHSDGHYKNYRIERIQAVHPCPDAPTVRVRRPNPVPSPAEQPGLW
jgi:DNA polymerase III epsilon subunit family exonuclease